jgi:uncharacterized protein YprB with RNaseH-like and TPR domain
VSRVFALDLAAGQLEDPAHEVVFRAPEQQDRIAVPDHRSHDELLNAFVGRSFDEPTVNRAIDHCLTLVVPDDSR